MSKLCILHVDDDQSIRELTALAFDLAGDGEVHSASSGAEALRMLGEGLSPDVMLLDVMMPEMDGPALLRHILATPGIPPAPAIFMTAQTQVHELDALLALGAVGVVIKPFDPLSLSAEVRSLLGGAT